MDSRTFLLRFPGKLVLNRSRMCRLLRGEPLGNFGPLLHHRKLTTSINMKVLSSWASGSSSQAQCKYEYNVANQSIHTGIFTSAHSFRTTKFAKKWIYSTFCSALFSLRGIKNPYFIMLCKSTSCGSSVRVCWVAARVALETTFVYNTYSNEVICVCRCILKFRPNFRFYGTATRCSWTRPSAG